VATGTRGFSVRRKVGYYAVVGIPDVRATFEMTSSPV
jgi:hypothetical protein